MLMLKSPRKDPPCPSLKGRELYSPFKGELERVFLPCFLPRHIETNEYRKQINCSRGLRMSKKSSNFVVETDYAEEIPTCRDLALRPFLLSEKSEIFRVAMRGRRNGLRGRNPDLSGFGAPSVPPLRKIRDFSGCHAGRGGGWIQVPG